MHWTKEFLLGCKYSQIITISSKFYIPMVDKSSQKEEQKETKKQKEESSNNLDKRVFIRVQIQPNHHDFIQIVHPNGREIITERGTERDGETERERVTET